MDPIILDILKSNFPLITQPELQEKIAEVSQLTDIPAGKMILDIGSNIKVMPLLVKGSLKIIREDEEGNELLMYYIIAGQSCAMTFTCCTTERTSEIRAVTEEDCALILIPVRHINEWMIEFKSWRDFVMRTYQLRFDEMLKTIDSIAFMNMDKRLLRYLEEKAAATSTNVIKTTHQEIADEMNSSREVISRLLKQMEFKKIVTLSRNQINLL